MTNKTPEIPPETTSTEDSSGGTASSTAAEGSQRLTAWNAGLVWDRTRHALAVAFITRRSSYADTATNLAGQLALAVRPLVESTEQKDELTGLIDKAREELFSHLHSEHFAEEWADCARELDPDRNLAPHENRSDLLHDLAAHPDSEMEQIRQELERRMDEENLRIFRLGIEVNRGVDSKDVLHDLAPADSEIPDVVDYSEWSMAGSSDPRRQPQPSRRRYNIPTDLRIDWRDRPVTDLWRKTVEVRWDEAGLPIKRLPWHATGSDATTVGALATVDAVVEVAEKLLGTRAGSDDGQSGDNTQGEEVKWESIGYLGLEFCENRRSVRREGYGTVDEFQGPLKYNLFKLLAQSRYRFVGEILSKVVFSRVEERRRILLRDFISPAARRGHKDTP